MDVGPFGERTPTCDTKEAGAIVGSGKEATTMLGDEATIRAGVGETMTGLGLPLYVGALGGKLPTCDREKAGVIVGS